MKPIETLKEHWKIIGICSLIDLAFFALLFLLLGYTSSALMPHIQTLNQITLQTSQNSMEKIDTVLMQNPDFVSEYTLVLKLTGYLILGIFALWLVFSGIDWLMIRKTIKPQKKYLLKFIPYFILWYLVYLLVMFGAIMASQYLTINGIPDTWLVIAVCGIFFIIIEHFEIMTYSMSEYKIKQIFKTSIHKRTLTTLLARAGIYSIFLVLGALLLWGGFLGIPGIALFILILVLLRSWSRIHTATVAHETIHKTH